MEGDSDSVSSSNAVSLLLTRHHGLESHTQPKSVLWLHVIYSTTANSRNTLFRTQLLVTPDYIDMLLWP